MPRADAIWLDGGPKFEVFSKLIEEAASGKGQILAMVGEPGIGKSRLVHEFIRHQLRPGWLVLEAASVSYGKATPYFPLIEMLRRYFQIADGEGSENIQEQVVTHILELDKVLKEVLSHRSFHYWGVARRSSSVGGNWPNSKTLSTRRNDTLRWTQQQRRRLTFDAVKRVLIRESQRQPLLIRF